MAKQSFGKYVVTQRLGRGGMAEVYQAHDPVLDRHVAIKVILPHLAAEEGFVARFLAEAKLIASLRHPHLVQLFDFAVENDQPYMVMEYLAGGTLKTRLTSLNSRGARMALGDMARLLEALAGALDYAHARGAIHRDIKPANILFTAQDDPVLADFGIARLLDQSVQLSLTGGIVGTPAYMSPEQAESKTVDARSDLYSLGTVVYELATGRVPFQAETPTGMLMQHVTAPPPPPRTFNPNLPPAVEKVILQALAKAPADRFASAGAFAQAFRAAMRGQTAAVMAEDMTVIEPASSPPTPTPAVPPAQQTGTTATSIVFVARDQELAQLQTFLDQAMAGQGQVCFVRGEAGAGKTALVTEFVRRAGGSDPNLVTAIGNCNIQSGLSDPYLPFRELLARLTTLSESELFETEAAPVATSHHLDFLAVLGRALAEYGPDLIDIFVSGNALAAYLAAHQTDRSQWMEQLAKLIQFRVQATGQEASPEQSHIFEQYTNVLKVLAAQQPLLLVVDDLQWADSASIELLFHLGRRIEGSRILLIGTYRPEDIALGRAGERHPLEGVLNELKRYLGGVEINLRQTQESGGREFVDALLDSQPNQLGKPFRDALLEHTGGHALFTVELLRNMQERGDLLQDETGCWAEGPTLDWNDLPPRVEGVIEERIGRLAEELRETLTIASIEGEDFTAEVVARVQNVDERGLIRRLSRELDRQHRLVGAAGLHRISGRRLSLYRFRHNLFQHYLYNQLDEVERAYFHEDVGTVLEALYGDDAAEIAVQLAWHFTEADRPDKARHYLYLAGEQARRRYANTEAIAYFNRALDLTPETGYTGRYALLLARAKAYDVQGARQAQYQDLTTLETLADILNDDQRGSEIALLLAIYAEATGDYAEMTVKAQEAIELATVAQDEPHQARGYLQWGRALLNQSDYAESRPKLEQAFAVATAKRLRQVEADSLRALGIVAYYLGDYGGAITTWEQGLEIYQMIGDRRGERQSLSNLGLAFREQGQYADASRYFDQALRLSREIGDLAGEGYELANLGLLARDQGRHTASRKYYEQSLKISRQIDDRSLEAMSLLGLGNVYKEEGEFDDAAHDCQEALLIFREIGDRRFEHLALKEVANIALELGDYSTAYSHDEQALVCFRQIGDRQSEGDTLNQLALLAHKAGDDKASSEYSQKALTIAQEMGEPWLESEALTYSGHALTSLGQLKAAGEYYQRAVLMWREQNRPDLAMESLAGLARIALTEGHPAQALAYVEEIVAQLADETFSTAGMAEAYLTCYRVLQANDDSRAEAMLTTVYNQLQARAIKIADNNMRASYLENVTVHREIVSEWQALQQLKPDDLSDEATAVE
jgi:adenylate cyclase